MHQCVLRVVSPVRFVEAVEANAGLLTSRLLTPVGNQLAEYALSI